MVELFRDDPQFAAEYLNALLQEGEPADLLVGLRQIAQAHGVMRVAAEEMQLNANQLYRTLSRKATLNCTVFSAVVSTTSKPLLRNAVPQS